MDIAGLPPGAVATQINSSNQIVGAYGTSLSDLIHGFLYSGGTYITLDFPGASITSVSDINNLGQVVGTYSVGTTEQRGFLYSGGVFTPIDVPGASVSTARGINDAGQIVGRARTPTGGFRTYSAFLDANGNPGNFDWPVSTVPGSYLVRNINNSGQIIGDVFSVP